MALRIDPKDIPVPASVPKENRELYIRNFRQITHETGRLVLFAGDQKIEHLNDDFYGEGIPADDAIPEHLFAIADRSKIGCFASQLGLIASYGPQFPNIPYLVKLNSKTHLVPTATKDPLSRALWSVDDVVKFRETSGLKILGVGYTIYLGSQFEDIMLAEAAQIVNAAHRAGLVTVVWVYPRGASVKDEKDPHLIAGAAGVAACLGTDFVKINPPKKEGASSAELLKEAVLAAGHTRVVCAGGSSDTPEKFLQKLHEQVHVGGTSGSATGRNVHQRSLAEAVGMCNAIAAIVLENKSPEEALAIYQGK